MDMMAGQTQWKTRVVMRWHGLRMWHDTYHDMEYDGVLMMMYSMKDEGSDDMTRRWGGIIICMRFDEGGSVFV